MTLGELLKKRQEAIVGRWLDGALDAYGEDASAAFRRQKDPFANPVGHNLRLATRAIFEGLLDGMDAEGGMDAEKAHQSVKEIVRIRAVQQFSASEAVGFVFGLKDVLREELREVRQDPRLADDLAKFERQIDQVALVAFDVFVRCREQLSELRINEVKRSVSWVVKKMNQRQMEMSEDTAIQDTASEDAAIQDTASQDTASEDTASEDTAAQREGGK